MQFRNLQVRWRGLILGHFMGERGDFMKGGRGCLKTYNQNTSEWKNPVF